MIRYQEQPQPNILVRITMSYSLQFIENGYHEIIQFTVAPHSIATLTFDYIRELSDIYSILHLDYPMGMDYNFKGSNTIDYIVDKISHMHNWVNLPVSKDDILKMKYISSDNLQNYFRGY